MNISIICLVLNFIFMGLYMGNKIRHKGGAGTREHKGGKFFRKKGARAQGNNCRSMTSHTYFATHAKFLLTHTSPP